MNNWSYINYDNLIQLIIEGNHSIQQPFTLNSLDNTQTKNLSFLNYLLSYDNINKENILEILYRIYAQLHNKIQRIHNNNKCIQNMINRIKDEWFIEKDIKIIPDEIIDYDYFKNNHSAIKEYKDICNECDNIYSLCKTEGDIPYESRLFGSLPMVRYVESIDIILDQALKKIDHQIETTTTLIQLFNEPYVPLLLDLSIKHKSLYNFLDTNNEIVNVPDNIHLIFSNYLFIHNLLHKQSIQNIKYLNEIISDLKLRIEKIKGLKGNIETLSEISKRIPDENEEYEKEIEIEKEIYNNDTVNKIGELSGGKVSDKLLSFF